MLSQGDAGDMYAIRSVVGGRPSCGPLVRPCQRSLFVAGLDSPRPVRRRTAIQTPLTRPGDCAHNTLTYQMICQLPGDCILLKTHAYQLIKQRLFELDLV